ncbi:hypothetical protein [uncultured Marinobacter sp.]|uniref:hypothetical protein n=1 Tax=uncultured Marinobacter sp. TaxID=187379 RepID=UPI0026167A1C|nr:hypothetical protein [uncultured Marinobacter sp.]
MFRLNIALLLVIFSFFVASPAVAKLDRQEVFRSLMGGEFNYESRDARMLGLELFERMLQGLGQSVKAPTPAEKSWVTAEINKIGDLDVDSMARALGELRSNPVNIQRKIEVIVSNSEVVFSKIRNSKDSTTEAYWWVQLSQLLLDFQEADQWPEILVRSNKAYTPVSSLRGTIGIIQDLPPKVNLILLRILTN